MINMQLTYDVLRIIGFDQNLFQMVVDSFTWLGELASAGKIAQGRFIVRRD